MLRRLIVGYGSWNTANPQTKAYRYATSISEAQLLADLQNLDGMMFLPPQGPAGSRCFKTRLSDTEFQVGYIWDDDSVVLAIHRLDGPFAGWSLLAH